MYLISRAFKYYSKEFIAIKMMTTKPNALLIRLPPFSNESLYLYFDYAF